MRACVRACVCVCVRVCVQAGRRQTGRQTADRQAELRNMQRGDSPHFTLLAMATDRALLTAFKKGQVSALLQTGLDLPDVCRCTGVAHHTVYSWRASGFWLFRQRGQGRRCSMDVQMDRRLSRTAAADPTLTISELGVLTGCTTSRRTIRHHLDAAGFASRK